MKDKIEIGTEKNKDEDTTFNKSNRQADNFEEEMSVDEEECKEQRKFVKRKKVLHHQCKQCKINK